MSNNRREALLVRLRSALLQWEAAMRRSTYAQSVEITPVQEEGFSVIFRWKDGSVFEKKFSDEAAFGMTAKLSCHAAQLQWQPCRYRKEAIDAALRFKGI